LGIIIESNEIVVKKEKTSTTTYRIRRMNSDFKMASFQSLHCELHH